MEKKFHINKVALFCLYKLLLGLVYSEIISKEFEYEGFTQEMNQLKIIEAWLAYAVIIFYVPKKIIKPSDIFILLTVLVYIAPLTVYYSQTNSNGNHYYIVLLGFFLINIFRHGGAVRFRRISIGRNFINILLFICIITALLSMYNSGATSYFNLDINAVYGIREDVSELIDRGVLAYLNNWVYNTFMPCLLVISLWQRSVIKIILIFALLVIFFGISTHKSILFYPIAVVFTFFWMSGSRSVNKLIIAFILVILIPYLSFNYFDEIISSDILIRRIFFVPAYLTFKYYEFFSANGFIYWGNGVGRLFFSYELNDTPAKIIGHYIGGNGSANNSFFSTGYMNAGVLGVVVYATITALIFKIIDGFTKSTIPFSVVTSVTVVPVLILITSSDLLTSLLTHGLGMIVIMLYLMDSTGMFNRIRPTKY